jgi:hypothetical protein
MISNGSDPTVVISSKRVTLVCSRNDFEWKK